MLVTLLVLNEDRSSEVNDEQPENVLCMVVTLLVLKEDTSSDVNEEQP